MNTIKFALLGTAALAAVSVSAQASTASDIAALKAQVEALSAQVAANEASTSVPAGFQLVTVSQQPAIVVPGIAGDGRDVTTIAIVPTADAPASTVIQWSGFARAALVYSDGPDTVAPVSDQIYFNVKARGQINVVGKTDTAVGEVGAQLSVRGNWDSNAFNPLPAPGSGLAINGGNATAVISNAWGWWKMTPDLTLAGGFNGSLSSIGYGYDGSCSCYYTDNARAGTALNGDTAQMRLTYSSGPMTAAIALEDGTSLVAPVNTNVLAVAAKVGYVGDMFSAAVSGGFEPAWTGVAEAKYVAAIGGKVGLGDVGFISMEADVGSGHALGDNFWGASILGSLNLSDQAHFEVAYNHAHFDATASDEDAVLAGIYYEPVSQLTIGLEGEWIKDSSLAQSGFSADLVTVFRF
jgi:hypothetical protein